MDIQFGVWLKKRRRRLDLTQEDLAARAFCSVNSIRKIEARDLIPSKALALELARAGASTFVGPGDSTRGGHLDVKLRTPHGTRTQRG